MSDSMYSGPSLGHRQTQSFAVNKQSLGGDTGFSYGSFHSNQPSIGGYSERHPQRASMAPINTGHMQQQQNYSTDMQTPQTGFDPNFTPLLPSQLLMGSPFQPGSPSAFQSPQFQSFPSFPQQNNMRQHQQQQQQQQPMPGAFQHQHPMSPQMYQNMTNPNPLGASSFFNNMQSPATGFNALNAQQQMAGYGQAMPMAPGNVSGTSRTVYLGNIPPDTPAEEVLSHVRSGQIESVRLLPDKNCAFISFLDGSSATHFHSDAILKKLSIKGQDIKIGWGKPSSVPTSVALAMQQNGASRNVYLGNLPEETTEDELREDLSKFGPIDTVKIVREKAIGFVHFLSISNAIKAVTQLPQEPKWQTPRRVYYGKDRCAYVSKTQQQNAAQYLGIAPGYAHVLNGADRDLITNALAQQSVAAAAVATTAGGINNLGNRTVYLGNIHPETTIEEICNVVRGGLLHHIRYIPDKHICFVTFIDATSAASFYALSNLQGLMIHNRRLKIGWGKHSGALPPAIALAVSGGASRNVYVGNLDETWGEDRLRQDFADYGEIELINTLREKSCAFVNFTNIANAIKAIEAVRGKEEYKRFKVNFGKDRCGNPPRQLQHQGQNHTGQQPESGGINGSNGGIGSPSPVNGAGLNIHQHRNTHSISPASGGSGSDQNQQGPTASAILNSASANPLTLYLAATQAQAQAQAQQQQQGQMNGEDFASEDFVGQGHTSGGGSGSPGSAFEPHQPGQRQVSGLSQLLANPIGNGGGTGAGFGTSVGGVRHAATASASANGMGGFGFGELNGFGGGGGHGSGGVGSNGTGGAGGNGGNNGLLAAPMRSQQHLRAVSLPAFGLGVPGQQGQGQGQGQGGFVGGYEGINGLNGWAEEEGVA